MKFFFRTFISLQKIRVKHMQPFRTIKTILITGFILLFTALIIFLFTLHNFSIYSIAIQLFIAAFTILLILLYFHFITLEKAYKELHEKSELSQKQLAEVEKEVEQNRVTILRSAIDGQDGERRRLSRELHDSVGQALIAIKLTLESSTDRSDSQMRATVDVAKKMVDETIDEVRRVSNALLPAALDEFGIISALRARCEEMARIAGMKITFHSEGNLDHLDKKSKTYLYRIAQEGINNAIKHSHAECLLVNLQRDAQKVELIITDDGKGFTFVPDDTKLHQGIQNIRERVSILNGSFKIESQPQQGTRLKISIPYISNYGKNKDHIG